jgi:hypothetical protein
LARRRNPADGDQGRLILEHIISGGNVMRIRIALAALAAAFFFATALATVTTVREVKTHTSSLPQPAAHI